MQRINSWKIGQHSSQIAESIRRVRGPGGWAFQTARQDWCASRKGQSVVEFAVVASLLVCLMFGIIDMGRLFFVQMSLQNAVREAARYAVTGQHRDANTSRVGSIEAVAADAVKGLGLDQYVGQISVCSNGICGSAGGPGDMVTISLTTDLKLLTPVIRQCFTNGNYHFTVSTTMKNEPFPPGNAT